MGRNARVDQVPMLHDDGVLISRSAELAVLASPDTSVTVENDNESDVTGNDLYSAMAPSGPMASEYDAGRHEHLLRSGPMGRCNDPYCTTCPSYFGYTENTKPTHGKGKGRRGSYVGAAWKILKIPIFNPHSKIIQQWNKIFCISSLIAVFVDPLFFLLFSVIASDMCLVFNNTAAVVVTVIRSATDSVHLCHIFLQFRLAYLKASGDLEDRPREIARQYLKTWFLLDVFTALPLPQIMIWLVVKRVLKRESGANYAKNVLRVVVLVQNIPRSIRFFPLLIGRSPSAFVFETAWANFVINLFIYFLAGHIVGCSWYLFGLQRVNRCLREGCKNETKEGTINPCDFAYLDCGTNHNPSVTDDPSRGAWKNTSSIFNNCIASPTFAYGIYDSGVKVIIADSTFTKYIYSSFWGFQQISTLAGNQVPSTFVWEVLFTFGIVALGLLLFALLIGNMQNFLQALGRRKHEMQLKRYDTELWMKQRRLPDKLQKRVRQAGRYKWRMTGGVDEEDLLQDLQEDLQMDIQRYLSLELVKKVRLFELLEDHVLDAICERLYQRLYIEGSEIIRAKQPVERMLFIVRGELESFGEDGSTVKLTEGQFCGEELLSWYIDTAGVSTNDHHPGRHKHKQVVGNTKYPQSSRNVVCLTNVEAFCLDSDGLEYITTHYKHALRHPHVQGAIRNLSQYWRSLAAIRIQKAWRKYLERKAKSPTNRGNRHRQTRFGRMYDEERRNSNATSGEERQW